MKNPTWLDAHRCCLALDNEIKRDLHIYVKKWALKSLLQTKEETHVMLQTSAHAVELHPQLRGVYFHPQTHWQANLEPSENTVKAPELIKGYELLPELWEEKAVFILADFSACSDRTSRGCAVPRQLQCILQYICSCTRLVCFCETYVLYTIVAFRNRVFQE